jgi:hypothetical protein
MKKPKRTTNRALSKAGNIPKCDPTREEITAVAHSIWEREGRPEGRDVQHWLEAESQLRQHRNSIAAPPS